MYNFTVKDRHGGNGQLVMGKGCRIDPSVSIDTTAGVLLGDRVILSDGVLIFTHAHDKNDPLNHMKVVKSKLVIENDAYVGARAIILGQVNVIGRKSVIGAGAVVTKDVEPFTIVAGNPARKIGMIDGYNES